VQKRGAGYLNIQISVALENHANGIHCGRELARSALSKINPQGISFALLFVSHPQPGQVLKGVRETLGHHIPLIGATSAGEYSHEGYVEDGAGLMLIHNEHIQFHILEYRKRWLRMGSLLGQLHGNTEAGLKSPFHHRTLMLFPDDASMRLNHLVDTAIQETAMLYDIIGGPGPTIPAPPRTPALFYNGQVFNAGFAGAEILSRHPVGSALANGWEMVSGPYRITKVDDHRVIRLDGRPAQEVYEDFALEQGMALDDGLPHDFGMNYPIGVCENGDCRVSLGMGFEANGALKVTSPPAANSLVHILAVQPAAMVAAARRAVQHAMNGLENRRASGAVFIDCMSTAMLLEDAYRQQQQAVREALGDVPFLGFRSHGVLARLKGQISGHFECSVGACILPG
jgi:hypothetical protein